MVKSMTQILKNAGKSKPPANENKTRMEAARQHFVDVQAKALAHKIEHARFMTAWTMAGRITTG